MSKNQNKRQTCHLEFISRSDMEWIKILKQVQDDENVIS